MSSTLLTCKIVASIFKVKVVGKSLHLDQIDTKTIQLLYINLRSSRQGFGVVDGMMMENIVLLLQQVSHVESMGRRLKQPNPRSIYHLLHHTALYLSKVEEVSHLY